MLRSLGRRSSRALAALAATLVCALALASCAGGGSPAAAPCGASCRSIERLGHQLVAGRGGPPGLIVLVDDQGVESTYSFGTSRVGAARPITVTDHLRLASVSKAYSGAVALALVARGTLHLSDTLGRWVPGLPQSWRGVTLAELLQHTSGIPDFIRSPGFGPAVTDHPFDPPPPFGLVRLAFGQPLTSSPPGSAYHYSNSDNELVGLMVEHATGRTYERELADLVTVPLHLSRTTLPRGAAMPAPFAHGYSVEPGSAPVDETHAVAAGWSWASGGLVATPSDTDRFVRAYVRGATTDPAVRAEQFRFRPGSSEPPGPGTNSVGLAVFRYRTACGALYGHTGNTLGYTQFAAATADGSRSVVVQVNGQITPATAPAEFVRLRQVEQSAVCAALGH